MDQRKIDEEAIRSLVVNMPKALLACGPLLLLIFGGLLWLVVSMSGGLD
jgi:hypothetical protein